MPYIRVIHSATHPSHEEVEHQCADCDVIFIDNSRSTVRCDPCKVIRKKKMNDDKTTANRKRAKEKQSGKIKVNKNKQK